MFDYLLGWAGASNHPRRARKLLEHGADPNSVWAGQTWSRITQHQNAMAMNHTQIADLLLQYGAVPAPFDAWDTFQSAAFSDDEPRHRALFRHTHEFRNNAGTLLVWEAASKRDDVRLARRLLDLATPVEFEVDAGFRALHHAAAWNAVHVLALLLERGAQVDVRDREHNATPLGWGLHHAAPDTPVLLAAKSEDVFALSKGGFVARLETLATTNPQLFRRRTALPLGFGSERIEKGATALFALPLDEGLALSVVECLLVAGVDANASDADGFTAADHAERRRQYAVAARLRA